MLQPIELETFLERVNIPDFQFHSLSFLHKVKKVVSLRAVSKVLSINAMPVKYLEKLLRFVILKNGQEPQIHIFQNSKIWTQRIDPQTLKIGQTFVERNKYQLILENFKDIFSQFCIPKGIAKLTALIVVGSDEQNEICLAHYLPPIIEVHNEIPIILDGTHRMFLGLNIGTTMESIMIRNSGSPFPCTPNAWSKIQVLDQKPLLIEDRFFNLKEEFFRDLEFTGIDG